MPKEYARIVCMVGANMRNELRQTTREPLPERIRDLLRKLDERQESAGEPARAASTPRQVVSHKRGRKGGNKEV